ncbi:DnaB-like helicase C-terminal domain-containing protein [Gracilibacillus sp. YIM 98692]|uniref:replicative DNA helicase n=1 Tax=Gracilibacillus sp. YIM 98692 TaxID=2663532 RepID=UPI0013D51BCF|nr:DnaB-like helicase C-terminal domain-containing protein [Gracilibacillus sp. YIM 98692]
MQIELLERQLLGCFLKDNTLIEEAKITPGMMEKSVHQVLFRAMVKLHQDGKGIDQVTLLSACYEELKRMGGIDFLNTLKTDGVTSSFESYQQTFLEVFKEKEVRKQLEHYLASGEPNTDQLMVHLENIADKGVSEEQEVQDVLLELHKEPFQEKGNESMITTGLKSLDKLLIGFEKKTSIIVGARPSMGKTALMLRMAKGACEQGVVPIIFSLEMYKKALLRRMISTEAKINGMLSKQSHMLTDAQKRAWSEAIGVLGGYDVEIFDDSMKTIQDMRSDIRRVMKKYPNREFIVFIDYLTKIQTKETYQSEHLRVTYLSHQLKAMAKDYDLPVVTLAQLSREVEKRRNKRPMLSDLRESGSIEQDADVIVFLYRDDYYHDESETPNILDVNVAKNRDGAIGNVELFYNKATGIIADLEVRE